MAVHDKSEPRRCESQLQMAGHWRCCGAEPFLRRGARTARGMDIHVSSEKNEQAPYNATQNEHEHEEEGEGEEEDEEGDEEGQGEEGGRGAGGKRMPPRTLLFEKVSPRLHLSKKTTTQ